MKGRHGARGTRERGRYPRWSAKHRRRVATLVCAAAALVGCSNASPFVGTFQGTATLTGTVRETGEAITEGPFAMRVQIDEDSAGGLFIASSCPLDLEARNDRVFDIVPRECAGTGPSGTVTTTIVRGTGALDEPTLVLEYVASAAEGDRVVDATTRFEGTRTE
jgi:hypothetical protein